MRYMVIISAEWEKSSYCVDSSVKTSRGLWKRNTSQLTFSISLEKLTLKNGSGGSDRQTDNPWKGPGEILHSSFFTNLLSKKRKTSCRFILGAKAGVAEAQTSHRCQSIKKNTVKMTMRFVLGLDTQAIQERSSTSEVQGFMDEQCDRLMGQRGYGWNGSESKPD